MLDPTLAKEFVKFPSDERWTALRHYTLGNAMSSEYGQPEIQQFRFVPFRIRVRQSSKVIVGSLPWAFWSRSAPLELGWHVPGRLTGSGRLFDVRANLRLPQVTAGNCLCRRSLDVLHVEAPV